MEKKYAYTYSLEEPWNILHYDFDYIFFLAKENRPEAKTIYIAETRTYIPHISADGVIERLKADAENAFVGSSYDLLLDVTEEEEEDLSDYLTEAYIEWGKDTGNLYYTEIPLPETIRLYDIKSRQPID